MIDTIIIKAIVIFCFASCRITALEDSRNAQHIKDARIIASSESRETYQSLTSTSTKDACTSFEQIYGKIGSSNIYSTCSRAVDYEFYVPAGVSLQYFENIARSQLNDSSLSILSPSCLVSLTKVVCSKVYMKCAPNIDISDPTTWPVNIYEPLLPITSAPIQLPFQRPCLSVCQNAVETCGGSLFPLIHIDLACTTSITVLFYASAGRAPKHPLTFDPDNKYCNSMTSSFDIASTSEVYIGSACTGIIDRSEKIFIPPPSSIHLDMAPYQVPYLVQTMIDDELTEIFSTLPTPVDNICMNALKTFYCRSKLVKSIPRPLLSGLDQTNIRIEGDLSSIVINIPSYPTRSICESYESKCKLLFADTETDLNPDCDEVIESNGRSVKLFPLSSQIVFSVSIPGLQTLNYYTSPDEISQSASDTTNIVSKFNTFKTQCSQFVFWLTTPENQIDTDYTRLTNQHTLTSVTFVLLVIVSVIVYFRKKESKISLNMKFTSREDLSTADVEIYPKPPRSPLKVLNRVLGRDTDETLKLA